MYICSSIASKIVSLSPCLLLFFSTVSCNMALASQLARPSQIRSSAEPLRRCTVPAHAVGSKSMPVADHTPSRRRTSCGFSKQQVTPEMQTHEIAEKLISAISGMQTTQGR
jgi:hypothetical protein